MSESIAEKLKAMERRAYLDAHSGEYPFPLDGSEWARLISERKYLDRHPHCRCESCENLLTRLHGKNSLLKRQHIVVAKALHHWFLQDEKIGSLYWSMREQKTVQELAKSEIQAEEEHPLTLMAAEKDWLSKKVYAKKEHLGLLEDEFLTDLHPSESSCDQEMHSIEKNSEKTSENVKLKENEAGHINLPAHDECSPEFDI